MVLYSHRFPLNRICASLLLHCSQGGTCKVVLAAAERFPRKLGIIDCVATCLANLANTRNVVHATVLLECGVVDFCLGYVRIGFESGLE